MNLKKNPGIPFTSKRACIDYVQFGRDDLIPFFTFSKSQKLCGNRTGFHYDEPDGKLLVWLYLAPRTRTSHSQRLGVLTVVVTAYKRGRREDSTDFR